MIRLSQRSESIQPQPMFRIMEQAQELERQGKKIIHLEIGDTTGFVNERLRELVVEEAGKSRFGYSPSAGEMCLREAVAEMYSKAKGEDFTAENVAIAPANSLITQVLAAVTERGDGVMFPVPGFPTYGLACRFLGLLPNEGEIKAIIVNQQSNPLGQSIHPGMIEILPQAQRGVVIFDDAYRLFDYTTSMPIEHRDNYVYLWSLSKEEAAPGLRIGAVIGAPEVVKKVADFSSLMHSCSPGFIQTAVARYLREGPQFHHVLAAEMPRRAALATEILSGSPHIEVSPHNAGFFLWCRLQTSMFADVARDLLDAGIAVCPGRGFGGRYDEFRISLSVPEADLIEGCKRIVQFADSLERRAA